MIEMKDIKRHRPPCAEPILVTNNLSARDAHGNMSHLWLVLGVLLAEDGSWVAFTEGYKKIYNITHWTRLPPEARGDRT